MNWPTVDQPVPYSYWRAKESIFAALREEMRFSGNLQTDADEGTSETPTPEEVIIMRALDDELRAALPTALDELTPNQRSAVELTAMGDLSRKQVADAMGVSPGAVAAHRDRGLKKLRALLQPLVPITVALTVQIIFIVIAKMLPDWLLTVFKVIGYAYIGAILLSVAFIFLAYLWDKLDDWYRR